MATTRVPSPGVMRTTLRARCNLLHARRNELYGAIRLGGTEDIMTLADTATGPARAADRRAVVRQLTELFPRFGRIVHALKSQLNAENRDQAALILLYPLCRLGPVRQGTLADLVHADPSTVSRHVATLVDQGLVRRVADET